jgi:3-methylcrotonyl-CoA carboxylase alpha subunit
VRVVRHGDAFTVFLAGAAHTLRRVDPLAGPEGGAAGGSGRVAAPIPARVVRVLVAAGDAVAKGAPLLVLEAMKMEMTLTAPADGIVEAVRATEGERVEEGVPLVVFAA